MMSLRAVNAGSGYQYLLRSVATNDATPGKTQLHDYYQAKGTPEGKWIGFGLAGLQSSTATAGEKVTEAQMSALYGEGLHPDTDALISGGASFTQCKLGRAFPVYSGQDPMLQQLSDAEKAFRKTEGRRPTDTERFEFARGIATPFFEAEYGHKPSSGKMLTDYISEKQSKVKQAVSAYDFTFSPVKSVSVLWALSDKQTANQVARLHHEAVAETLAWAEKEVVFTRTGKGGIRQVKTNGLLAAEFTHFDTRNGDPDLHSHVLVSNKVQGVDGNWRALDGRPLFEHSQVLSSRYNLILQNKLESKLGLEFRPRSVGNGKNKVWELSGISDEMIQHFSTRRVEAEKIKDELAAEFRVKKGRTPTAREMKDIWQDAILRTRNAKREAESLDTLRQQWADRAAELTTPVQNTKEQSQPRTREVFDMETCQQQVISEAISDVLSRRSVFKKSHLATAIAQQLRGFSFTGDQDLDQIQDHLVAQGLDYFSVRLSVDDQLELPHELQRADGKAIDHKVNQDIYTTLSQISREKTLVDALGEIDGPAVNPETVLADIKAIETAIQQQFTEGQKQLITHFLTSGTRLAVAVGAAGTGKTTAMKTVVELWKKQGNSVVGLAPSAAAAKVLSEDIGAQCHTIDSLTFRWEQGKNAGKTEAEIMAQPWFSLNSGDLVLVDEAAMASTKNLATLEEISRASGAVLRMVGDPQQLDSVETGGMFRTLTTTYPSPALTSAQRFKVTDLETGAKKLDTDQSEVLSNLRIGKGIEAGFAFYNNRGWLTSGAHGQVLAKAVDGFLDDLAQEKTSLVMAASNQDVTILNTMISEHFEKTGQIKPGKKIALSDGLKAGVGSKIVARKNTWMAKGKHTGTTARVFNGQAGIVNKIYSDGSLVFKDDNTGQKVFLDPDYVATNTQLGYASTFHRAQGATVDTAHAVLTPGMDRNAAYVGLSRGREGNNIYVVDDPVIDLDAEDAHWHMAGDYTTGGAQEVFTDIFSRDISGRSAVDELKKQQAEAASPDRLKLLYLEGQAVASKAYANAVIPELLGRLPAEVEVTILGDKDGFDALINATMYAADHSVDIRDIFDTVSGNLTGAHSPGRLIGSRIRDYADKVSPELDQLPPVPPAHVGQDHQLHTWLQKTRVQLEENTTSSAQLSEHSEKERMDAIFDQMFNDYLTQTSQQQEKPKDHSIFGTEQSTSRPAEYNWTHHNEEELEL